MATTKTFVIACGTHRWTGTEWTDDILAAGEWPHDQAISILRTLTDAQRTIRDNYGGGTSVRPVSECLVMPAPRAQERQAIRTARELAAAIMLELRRLGAHDVWSVFGDGRRVCVVYEPGDSPVRTLTNAEQVLANLRLLATKKREEITMEHADAIGRIMANVVAIPREIWDGR